MTIYFNLFTYFLFILYTFMILSLNTYKYSLSFLISTFIIVYLFDIPTLITSAPDLVYEYYYKNGLYNFFFDFFLIYIYISIGCFFIQYFKIKSFFHKIFIMILNTLFISTFFMFLFLYLPKSKSFFSRWFHRVSFKAVIYDISIVTFTFFLYSKLNI